jgi:hypothetical protein
MLKIALPPNVTADEVWTAARDLALAPLDAALEMVRVGGSPPPLDGLRARIAALPQHEAADGVP